MSKGTFAKTHGNGRDAPTAAIAVESNGLILGVMQPSVLSKSPTSVTLSTTCVLSVCVAQILGLASDSIAPALLPQLMDAWSLNGTQAGWLAGIISGGYMFGVILLVAAIDRISARTVYRPRGLADLVVALFFSRHWRPPPRATTPNTEPVRR